MNTQVVALKRERELFKKVRTGSAAEGPAPPVLAPSKSDGWFHEEAEKAE